MEKTKDKYSAVWVSHSSISNFLKCPRLYYLHDFYKDPKTNRKISIINPFMALGLAVHETIENISILGANERFNIPLPKRFEAVWEKYTNKSGGFISAKEEAEFKQRGIKMLKQLDKNPGLLKNKTIKIKTDKMPPNFFLSEEDNIILNGKIDWLEYLPKDDSVHIIDFKTGKNFEDETSLQMPIYLLLATNTQSKKVKKASYWYLENSELVSKELPNLQIAKSDVMRVANRIALARKLNHFVCEYGGCKHCIPYERVLKGEGQKVGTSDYQDIYMLPD